MNVTELARIFKIHPQELREILPQVGFHIGKRAIKIDNRTAQKIIKEWPRLIKELEEKKAAEAKEAAVDLNSEDVKGKKEISVPSFITVRDFSELAEQPISQVLSELMKNGVFVSMNEKIDFETASIIGVNLGLEVKLNETAVSKGEDNIDEEKKLEKILEKEDKKDMRPRPPVIVVMGHVDHGKTKLLDAIRRTDVVSGEAGGITQHIGAYQTERRKRLITFIDTPGHEAFTAMRSRGAKVADIAILIVAADDGVKPQTIEAFRIIEAAKIPYLVAINKIDKPGTDINKTKQELSSQLNITPEDWGGKVICVPISAKEGTGIEELLDTVLLIADVEADNIKANPKAMAVGTVIDSHVDRGAGLIATILIQNGTLRIGDQLCFHNTIYGKVRSLKNYRGEDISEAEPSTPAKILGFKILPEVGDMLESGKGKRVNSKKIKVKSQVLKTKEDKPEDKKSNEEKTQKVNLIIKSDALGSAEAIEESLEKISIEEMSIKIVHKGLGNITEGDIQKAEAAQAEIVGFHVKIPSSTEELIREKGVSVNTFDIIYDLVEYVRGKMQELIKPKIKRIDLGRLKVLEIFRTENDKQIVGGKVLEGKIENDCLIEVIQDKVMVATGKLIRLQSGKQDVKTVEGGEECGLQYEGPPVIAGGNILQFYKEEEIVKKI